MPDRILCYGVTGSGKSTAALAIGARTGLPVTLVDELTWLPGWTPVEDSVQRELLAEIVAGERWVLVTREPRCNGNVETWRNVIGPRSIIRWHFRSFARKRDRMRAWAASPDGPEVLLFTHPRELDAWLATLEPAAG